MLVDLINKFVAIFFFSAVYSLIVGKTTENQTFLSLSSYFLITHGLSDLFMVKNTKIGSQIRKDIKSGDFTETLIRPVNIIFAQISKIVGIQIIDLIFSLFFIVIGILILKDLSFKSFLLFLLFLIPSLLISFAFNMLEGVLSFFTIESGGLMNIYSHLVRIFGGLWIPLNLFPGILRPIVENLPFSYMIFVPYEVLISNYSSEIYLKKFFLGILWAIFLNFFILYFWKKGLKKYEAVGI